MSKPKVLVCILTGVERQNWINPDLSMNLVQMARDSRFDVDYFPVRDFRPYEAARNTTIHTARQLNADFLISFDNDNFTRCNPLDIVAEAGADKDIIGLSSGLGADGGGVRYRMYPPDSHGTKSGKFREEPQLCSGVLIIRNRVWKTISRGPWFRWKHAENSELLTPEAGSRAEIEYFCDLARSHGFKLWNYEQAAGHYRTTDITGMVCTLAQLTEQAKAAR